MGHPDPLLAGGTVALVLLAPVAARFTGCLQAGQQSAARLAWALAIVFVAPILTADRSLAVLRGTCDLAY